MHRLIEGLSLPLLILFVTLALVVQWIGQLPIEEDECRW